MNTTTKNGGQEPLFLVDPSSGGQLVGSGPNDEASRLIHLLGVVDLFAQINKREGLVAAVATPLHRPGIERRYGSRTGAVAQAAADNAELLHKQAKWEFARSVGMFALIEQDPSSEDAVKRTTAGLYEEFFNTYFGAKNTPKREAFGALLRNDLSALILGVSDLNRQEGARPHHKDTNKPKSRRNPDQQLSSRNRMLAIHNDPRAGFLPFSDIEKNNVMTFLDDLDNPKYPLGVSNQLLEVFNHQERLYPRDPEMGADRALQSIVYVLGDYLSNASQQLGLLRDLEARMAEAVNPNVTLLDQFGPDELAYAALARFSDVQRFVSDGVVDHKLGNILKTGEHRWTRRGPGRHKVVHDQYTHDTIDPVYVEHIDEFAASTDVREARGLVYRAVTNEQARSVFHRASLSSIAAVALTGAGSNLTAVVLAKQELVRLDAKTAA